MEWTKEVYKSLILSEVSEAMNEFFIFIDYEIRIFEPLNLQKFGWSEKRKKWIQSGLLHIVYWGKLQKKMFFKKGLGGVGGRKAKIK